MFLESGETIEADLIYWCAGVRRSEMIGAEPGAPFVVNRYLQSVEHPDAFALGDFATVDSRDEFAKLGSAQRAVYHGQAAGENLWRLETLRPMRPVRYRPAGELIGLGDLDGVGVVYGVPIHGLPAALAKKGNEIKYLAEFFRDLPRQVARALRSGRSVRDPTER